MTGPPAPAAALVLRDESLYPEADAAEKIAAMPAMAVVEMCPTNQVSVRLITACRLLFTMSGRASVAIAR